MKMTEPDATWAEMALRSITQTLGLYGGEYLDDQYGYVDVEFPDMEQAASWAKSRRLLASVLLQHEDEKPTRFGEPVVIQFKLEDYARIHGLPEAC